MVRTFYFLGSLSLGVLTLGACSATGNNSDKTSGGTGGGANPPGTIDPNGSGGGFSLGTGGSGADAATGGVTGVFTEEDALPCPGGTNEECCEQYDDCPDEAEYVCTSNNECARVGTECDPDDPSSCTDDTYCCNEECRLDGGLAVCIPNNAGPGLPCERPVTPGVFAPAVQCSWQGPSASDPEPNSKFVFTTPMVADTPVVANDGNSAEIVIISSTADDSPTASVAPDGTIRILSGQDCSLLASIADPNIKGNAPPALGDLDGDGDLEIVVRRRDAGLIAYHWTGNAYEQLWSTNQGLNIGTAQAWDGPQIHDMNGDGSVEILLRESVYDANGTMIIENAGTGNGATSYAWNGIMSVAGDFDGDGNDELVMTRGFNGINTYEWTGTSWDEEFMSQDGSWFGSSATHYAPADFDGDGNAELIAVNADGTGADNGLVAVYSATGNELWSVTTTWDPSVANPGNSREGGGPPTVGDFDGDGKPEFAIAGATRLRVFDEDCTGPSDECEAQYIRWSRLSQDASSRQTGASVFDFDGDGQLEVVYADECFLRVYSGNDGRVLFSSYRTSGTWYENPTVADVDLDQNTEIVVNSAYAVDCPVGTGAPDVPYVDRLHPGVACDDESGCQFGATCVDNLCRCTGTDQCCPPGSSLEECGLTCTSALPENGGDDVCRATHPNSEAASGGIRVLRDGLDRWTSSRPLWNQHAYSVTNINDDGSIPSGDWRNWNAGNQRGEALNTYRANVEGEVGVEDLPDITGRFSDDQPCVQGGASGKVFVQASVCNRGKRAVGAELPATFYLGSPEDNNQLCTSYTDGPVPTGSCKLVFCEISGEVVGQQISLVVNRDEAGNETVFECRPENNSSDTMVADCPVDVVR